MPRKNSAYAYAWEELCSLKITIIKDGLPFLGVFVHIICELMEVNIHLFVF